MSSIFKSCFLPGLLVVLGLGCSSDPSPAVGDAGGDVPASDTPGVTPTDTGPVVAGEGLRFTLNGEALDFPTASAGLSGNPILRWGIVGTITSPTRSLILGGVPNALGTTPCAVSMTEAQQMSYRAAGINADAVPAGECSVTITQLAPAVGEFVVGTFTGRLRANGGFIGNITNGSFRLRRMR